MESASYCLINAQTSEYIFSSDKEKIMTAAEDEYIKNIINNAGEIRKQSDVNNSLAQQLQDIVGSFKLN